MIDIHTHVLPFVDDGSSTIEESIKMLEDAVKQGITHLICTPHYFGQRHFSVSWTTVKEYFTLLEGTIRMRKLPIQVYLGSEIFYRSSTLQDLAEGRMGTLNNSRYVLLEGNSTLTKYDLEEIVYEFGLKGYIVIFAHVERYEEIYNASTLHSLHHAGALFQVDTEAILSKKMRKNTLQFIKDRLIDFVSSDVHFNRPCELATAYQMIHEKEGKDLADLVTILNPTQIIHNAEWKTL